MTDWMYGIAGFLVGMAFTPTCIIGVILYATKDRLGERVSTRWSDRQRNRMRERK